jgi:hypothetical protein
MPEYTLSKRKMESYRRAEVVAQAARQHIAAGGRVTQVMQDIFIHSVIDWLDVTGNVKFEKPKRRSRIDRSFPK